MSEETEKTRTFRDQDDSKGKKHTTATSSSGKRARIDGRTKLRKGLTPYLPPPVIKAMNELDPLLEPYVGPEASITVSSTLFLCFVIFQCMKLLSSLSRGGKAVADDDEDDALGKLNQTDDFGETVILVGPMWTGKTRLFYHLCHGDANLPTVMSLRANVALVPAVEEGKDKPVRVLDYPGHASLNDALFAEMMKSKPIPRIVMVVDSTQNMAPAADVLYDLFQFVKDNYANTKLNVFVACHKSDLSTSKNHRRVKIQLRTELEKLIQVRATKLEHTAAEGDPNISEPWWKKGEELDLENLKYARLRFEATTCNTSDGIDTLAEFVKTGSMD